MGDDEEQKKTEGRWSAGNFEGGLPQQSIEIKWCLKLDFLNDEGSETNFTISIIGTGFQFRIAKQNN
jgi:hypothetical protein